jgi:hypothetical protein
VAENSVNLNTLNGTTMLDIVVAPAAAAQRIVRQRHSFTALVLCFALPFAANVAMIQPRNAVRAHETILTALSSAAMQGIGAAVWFFLCFLLIGKCTKRARAVPAAWWLGVNASIVAAGIPAVAQAGAVRIAEAAYGSVPGNMASILPSLAWLGPQGTVHAALLAPFDMFLIWQTILLSQFLVVYGLPAWVRWLLGLAIAFIPPVVFSSVLGYMLFSFGK